MKRTFSLFVLLTSVALIALSCTQQQVDQSDKILPSEAQEKYYAAYRAQAGKLESQEERKALSQELAAAELENVKTLELIPEEELIYADLLNTAGKMEEAVEIAERLAEGDSLDARNASIKLMNISFDQENYEAVEGMIAEYRQRFKPTPDHLQGLYMPVAQLSYHYGNEGNAAKAVELIKAEVSSLPLDAPYSSYSLLLFAQDNFEAIGKKDEYIAMLNEYSTMFNAVLTERNANVPEGEEEKAEYEKTTKSYERLAGGLANSKKRIELVGQEAPDFNLSNFYNFDGISSLKDLRGKVVMIDFWANWCGPCKAAFPSMRELYAEYKDQGFVILGITSIQGRFYDGDIRESEVDEEREMELTEDFIARHEMTWPVAFSDRNVYDPEYGVSGIPTFAVIDKQGIIRMLKVGAGEASENALKEIIPQLLAE